MSCLKCQYAGTYINQKLSCLLECPNGFEKNETTKLCQGTNLMTNLRSSRFFY
jgi:hypothetical protein